jgi:hypothetical protein
LCRQGANERREKKKRRGLSLANKSSSQNKRRSHDVTTLIDIFFSCVTAEWKTKIEGYRAWFLEQENVKAVESKRPGKQKHLQQENIYGWEGSFRKLAID